MKKHFIVTQILFVFALCTAFSTIGMADILPPPKRTKPKKEQPAPAKKAEPKKAEPAKPAVKPAAKPAKKREIRFVKITIHSARVWPVNGKGFYWDMRLRPKNLPMASGKSYDDLKNDAAFKKACTGNVLTKKKVADPFVVLKIGKYEKFETVKINNTCAPDFNVSKTFRIASDDKIVAEVWDNDGAAKVRFKKELIGRRSFDPVPGKLFNGGKLVIRNFGRVLSLTLSATVVKKQVAPAVKPKTCDGVYRVRIVEAKVKEKRANGKSWDWGFGKKKRPDVIVELKVGGHTVTTAKKTDSIQMTFQNAHKTFAIKKGTAVNLLVKDKDLKGFESIGQTATVDACKLIHGSGKHVFKNFGQVEKVVVIFEKK